MTQQPSIEQFVGNKIRERRKLLKLNQTELATMLGISYQQVQKYESGATTLTLGRLMHIAQILNVQPNFFYDGAPTPDVAGQLPASEVITKTRKRPLQVLLIEDNSSDEILFKNAVEQCGIAADIHCMQQPDRVMDFLQNHDTKYGRARPDVIVLDLNLPKISGMELLRLIKKNQQLADIPVIILTNSIRVQEMQECYRLHAAGFIQKSIDFDEFCEDIATAMKYWAKTVILPAA
ncbi:MAG: response regulator [Alphaproteobacteria bacterium]|nr:response regulator [Alphaproteobacteria bacterium]